MDYRKLSITELHNALVNGDITPLELTKQAIANAKKDTNVSFEYICEKEALEAVNHLDESKKNNLLWGIPYVLKDNFSTKDIPTTASSDFLKNYVPVFSNEVSNRLDEQGAILIGKTTLDEFAMGGSGITGHLGKTYNPWDPTHHRLVGGSSCGSASACAAGIIPLAIGSDTGDSARKPGSYAGLVGFKPTWGRISRYGLFPFASSLDHVGFFTRNVRDAAITLGALAGRDEKDATSSERPVDDYLSNFDASLKGKHIAIIDEIYDSFANPVTRKAFDNVINQMQVQGAIIHHVHMDIQLCRAIYPVYVILSCAEATSNNAALDGIKYGERSWADNYEGVMYSARTNGFSEKIKRRFVIGSYSLLSDNQSDIFVRAQKCRRLIVNSVNRILEDNDAVFLPAAPSIAPLFEGNKFNSKDEGLIADNYLAIANFGGQPSLTLPIGFDQGMPLGGNLIGKIFDEANVLNIAQQIEDITGLANLIAPEK